MVHRGLHLWIHLEVRLQGVRHINLQVQSPVIRVVKLGFVILVEELVPSSLISRIRDFALIILFCHMKI